MALALLKVTVAVPAGGVVPFAGSVAPSGYLLCDGSVISRAAYPNLFAAIGTLHGAGDGTTTFALPDTRGIFLRGAGTHGSALNGKVPAAVLGTKQGDATAKNSLAISDPGHVHNVSNIVIGGGGLGVYGAPNYIAISSGSPNTSNASSNISLGVGDTETRPANIGVNYIIKT